MQVLHVLRALKAPFSCQGPDPPQGIDAGMVVVIVAQLEGAERFVYHAVGVMLWCLNVCMMLDLTEGLYEDYSLFQAFER